MQVWKLETLEHIYTITGGGGKCIFNTPNNCLITNNGMIYRLSDFRVTGELPYKLNLFDMAFNKDFDQLACPIEYLYIGIYNFNRSWKNYTGD